MSTLKETTGRKRKHDGDTPNGNPEEGFERQRKKGRQHVEERGQGRRKEERQLNEPVERDIETEHQSSGERKRSRNGKSREEKRLRDASNSVGKEDKKSQTKNKGKRKAKQRESREKDTLEDEDGESIQEPEADEDAQRKVNGVEKPKKTLDNQSAQRSRVIIRATKEPELETEASMAVTKRDEGHEASWTVSEPLAGKYIDRDPVFSPDEKFLIFATEFAVNIYSTSNSVMVQALQVGPSRGAISSYALSSIDSSILWAATQLGYIVKWNIYSGEELDSWQNPASIQDLSTSASPDGKQETLFTIDVRDEDASHDKRWAVTAHRFGKTMDASSSAHSTIYNRPGAKRQKKIKGSITTMKVLDGGNIVALASQKSIVIGEASEPAEQDLTHLAYTWRTFKCPEAVVCFDIKSQKASKEVRDAKNPRQRNTKLTQVVDIVVGGLEGAVHTYDDFLNRLKFLEDPGTAVKAEAARIDGKKFHWHREPVGAVTWSKDANYVISGGMEAVIVLWQLDTGRRQYLPNLESPVQNIIVSPSGSSYAVRLGDNSVMLLSTSELNVTAYVGGLQSTSFSKVPLPLPTLKTLEPTDESQLGLIVNRIAAALNPQNPNHLLVAVPSFQTSRGLSTGNSRASFVQDFDLSRTRHFIRQAVARANTLGSNIGPEGNRILEPEVSLLQMSADGRWLATVDQWNVPRTDLKQLAALGHGEMEIKELRLRFWSWNTQEVAWISNTLIEDPHEHDNHDRAGAVLDMASSPAETQFATIGTDSIVRVWMPVSKDARGTVSRYVPKSKQNGSSPVEKSPAQETWWTVAYYVHLEKSTSKEPLDSVSPTQAKLSYSNDGSIIAAYQFFEDFPLDSAIHLIDTRTGTVREVFSDVSLAGEALHCLGFLERYLICVAPDSATVWNVTTFEVHAHIPLIDHHAVPLEVKKRVEEKSQENMKDWELKRAIRLERKEQKRLLRDPDYAAAFVANNKEAPQEPLRHLAVDPSTSTFAIAVPISHDETTDSENAHPLLKYQSQLLVYSLASQSTPVFETTIPRLTSALLPAGGLQREADYDAEPVPETQGYVLLDVGAEIRMVRPSTFQSRSFGGLERIDINTRQPLNADDEGSAVEAPDNMVVADFDNDEDSDSQEDDPVGDIINRLASSLSEKDDNRPVVRSEQLAAVFDHPTHAMPPMEELFHNVLRLYAEKPSPREEEPAQSSGTLGGTSHNVLLEHHKTKSNAIDEAASEDERSRSESESEESDSSSDDDLY